MQPKFNAYCNESFHLTRGSVFAMCLGVLICQTIQVENISKMVRALKEKHRLKTDFEIKWTKVSPAKIDFYLALVDLVLDDDGLDFHGIIEVEDSPIDRSRDLFHGELYGRLFDTVLRSPLSYRIYLNVMDTRGNRMMRRLHDMAGATDRYCVERIQQVRSRESEILQVADLFAGALTYANRGLSGGAGKEAILERLRLRLGTQTLTSCFASPEFGFNVAIQRS